jgi:hypothetical protein
MAKKNTSLGGDISKSVKGTFSLDKFKAAKGLGSSNNSFKDQEWIPLSPAWQEMVSLPGIPHGHITLLRGHSDTGKTTALLEVAVNAQKMGILPVLIITEMKWSWEHAKMMGFQFTEEISLDGHIIIDGNFFTCSYVSQAVNFDVLIFKIHFVLGIWSTGMVVQRSKTQCNGSFCSIIIPQPARNKENGIRNAL